MLSNVGGVAYGTITIGAVLAAGLLVIALRALLH